MALIISAGILTPIGLEETVVAGSFVNAKFEYAVDPTPFGTETPPRDLYILSRTCAGGLVPCPGVEPSDFALIQQGGNLPNITLFDNYVLPNITDCFASGFRSVGDLRTSPFEIQYRQYQMVSIDEESMDLENNREDAKNKATNTTGKFEILEKLVLLDKIVVREGIVADLVNGGVGFRNHTVPSTPRMRHGAQWTEDILWLEPVTACVDTNWSVQHRQRSAPFSTHNPLWSSDLSLVNRGGGIVPTQIPDSKLINPPSQSDPELQSRALLAKSLFNYRLSEFLKLSRSNATFGSRYDFLDWRMWAGMQFWDFDGRKGLTLGPMEDPSLAPDTRWEPPDKIELDSTQFNLASFDVQAFQEYYSSRYSPWDPAASSPDVSIEDAYIDLVLVRCGFLLTPPAPTIEASEYSFQSLYVCASTVRATVKEVSFQYKQTSERPSLSDLSVSHVSPKNYSSRTSKPLWAVEKLEKKWNVSSIQPLWGIVDGNASESSSNFRTVEKESLYLPDFQINDSRYQGWGDTMAASKGPGMFLDFVYNVHDALEYHARDIDYQGTENAQMLAKWRELSASPETAAKIPNLIWTDLAANMLVGTKSLLSAFPNAQFHQVRSNKRRIFFDYAWAVPALICAAIWILCAVLCLLLCLFPKSRSRMRLSRLRVLINQLSVGRALVVAEKSNAVDFRGSTKEWLAAAGRKMIYLPTLEGSVDDGIELGSRPARGECSREGGAWMDQPRRLATTRSRRASF
ncbi:hypothetical protein EPUS_08199 [Endocarpon pusillum Z07020]|uniref:Uncharacterized protein n=1 Tax=Endocarpon pusillum (strain Z07020 / HMAS-L-300199) TaxID=1263415 RepID=U1G840_ENDPU|nr:uncharacterized protein EPUS_08199 [Endocarpon pusillum Z07020]ERF68133.1 hypothetical protein EPUS_08199 [Endocarpon pusillum Z07020]